MIDFDGYSTAPRSARHKVGDPVLFAPYAFIHPAETRMQEIVYALDGRVIYVNEAHRYYVAEAACNGYMIRESFKF